MLHKTSLADAFFHHNFNLGDSAFTATLFSKPRNWSLTQLTTKDEQARAAFKERLGTVLYDLGVGKALAPSPVKFTDKIIDPSALAMRVPLGKQVLHCNPDRPADGAPLGSGEAYVISQSSCPTTLMMRGDHALVLHTGRDCLVDRYGIEHGAPLPGRNHASIIFAGLHYLGRPEEVRVKVLWSIVPHLFVHDTKHPRYGNFNTKMLHVVRTLWGEDSVPMRGSKFQLDLPKLIRDQCLSRGVPEEHIDLRHAYQPAKGTWLDGAPGTPRNLVVIARRS